MLSDYDFIHTWHCVLYKYMIRPDKCLDQGYEVQVITGVGDSDKYWFDQPIFLFGMYFKLNYNGFRSSS